MSILRPKIAAAPRGLLTALVVAAGTIHGGAVLAQTAPGILAPGNAAVTGFSGAAAPQTIAPGADPEDKTFIDLNGATFRIIDLQNMGGPPAAQLVSVPKPYTATAAQIGQVFAVALDNATPPNIYVAATSAYGLPIVVGPNRTKRGRAGATFMPGLFGPRAQNGGPGSIWKIDGRSGAITRFANLTLNGADNPGPALGGLAFDPGSNTLLAADRSTGMIHRFDLSGAERGVYDHGIQGRLAAQLPPLPYDPSRRLDITKPSFDSTNPGTWGFAAPDRLIFGLAVRAGRLYYAVAVNMQIWSVGVAPNGAFGTDARVEITVPPGEGPSEISKITFDDEGRMLLAERPIPTGDYGFDVLTQEGIGRVLRYARQPDGTWQQEPDEYAIGFPLHLRNGNGGVAVGYSYAATGAIDRATCGGYLWSTGEQLRVSHDAAVAAQLAQGGAQIVNGLQGNAIALVRPANVPPLQSYYVDFDDKFDDPDARGHMGDIAVYRLCGLAQLPSGVRLPPGFALPPTGLALPPGLVFPPGGPLPPPPPQTCLPGTTPQPGYQCCPSYTYMDATGQCASICPPGVDINQVTGGTPNFMLCGIGFDPTTYDPSDLTKLRCMGGATPDWNAVQGNPNNFQYLCLSHSLYFNPPACPAGSTKTTFGQVPAGGFFPGPTGIPAIDNQQVCAPTAQQQACTGSQQIGADGQCHQLCPAGSDSMAYPIPPPLIAQCCPVGAVVTPSGQCCPPGSTIDPATGQCLPPPPPSDCPPGTVRQPGFQCCPSGTFMNASGQCAPPCPPGVDPAQSSGGILNLALCLAGIDPTTYNPAHPGFLQCIGGSTPALVNAQNVNLTPQLLLLACLDHSAAVNPPVCPAGSTKTTVGQTAGQTGIPAIDNEQICARTPQQHTCQPGQQIGLDGQCHQICPSGTGYPLPPDMGQCCAAGSVLTPTGQCCPPGSTVDPVTGLCQTPPGACPPVDCAPGQTFDPATCQCVPPPGACDPSRPLVCDPPFTFNPDTCTCTCPPVRPVCEGPSTYDPTTCQCVPRTPPGGCPQLDCVEGQTFNPATCKCEPRTPPERCPPERIDNQGHCCQPPSFLSPSKQCCPVGTVVNQYGTCCLLGAVPKPDGTCCPLGSTLVGGACVPIETPRCPPNQHWNGRQCLCDSNNLLPSPVTGQCPPLTPIPILTPTCPPGQNWNGRQCVCDSNNLPPAPVTGQCPPSRSPTTTPTTTPTPTCPPDQHWNGRQCVCNDTNAPPGATGGRCPTFRPPVTTCPAGQHWNGRQCLCNDTNAPPTGGQCPTLRPPVTTCPAGQHWNGRQCVCNDTNALPTGGQCPTRPTSTPCASGMIRSPSGVCVCPGGKVLVDGVCGAPRTRTPQCQPPYVLQGGKCVSTRVTIPITPPKVTPPKVTTPPKLLPPPKVLLPPTREKKR